MSEVVHAGLPSSYQTVRLWDAATGQALATLSGHINYVYTVVWSPDNTCLASASADQTGLIRTV